MTQFDAQRLEVPAPAAEASPSLPNIQAKLPSAGIPRAAGYSETADIAGVSLPRYQNVVEPSPGVRPPSTANEGLFSSIRGLVSSAVSAVQGFIQSDPALAHSVDTLSQAANRTLASAKNLEPLGFAQGVFSCIGAAAGTALGVPAAVVSRLGNTLALKGAELLGQENTFVKVAGGLLVGAGILGMLGGGVTSQYASLFTGVGLLAGNLVVGVPRVARFGSDVLQEAWRRTREGRSPQSPNAAAARKPDPAESRNP